MHMEIIRANADSVIIRGGNAIQLTITETPKGNIRVTETGRNNQALHVIPRAGNSVDLISSAVDI